MPITSTTQQQQLWPGLKKIFGTYKDKPLMCDMVFNVETSDKSYEKYVEETGFGYAPVKAEAASIQYDVDGEGYTSTLTNTTYGLGAKISQEAFDDNQYFDVGARKAKKLGRSIYQTIESVCANVLNRGFNSAYVGGDGVELFSLLHPVVGGTQSNELAVAADLTEASLEDLCTQIRNATDSRGLRISIKPKGLVVAPANEFNAHRIMASTLRSGTADNDTNALKDLGTIPAGVQVWDFLTDEDAWFVTTDADDGLIHQKRREMSLERDRDFDTSNMCMKATVRFAAGWSDWRGVYGSPGL